MQESILCRDVTDAKVRMIATDPDGSAATYGAVQKVGGIQEFSAKFESTQGSVWGDGRTLDLYAKGEKVTGSVKSALFTHDCVAAILGGAVVNAGSTPNQTRDTVLGDANLPYFELDVSSDYIKGNSIGDGHVIVSCAKAFNFTFGIKMKEYQEVSFDYEGKPLNYKDPTLGFRPVLIIRENETAGTQTVAAADTTPPTVSSIAPTLGQTGRPAAGNVVWTFSESLDPRTVNASNFLLIAAASGALVTFTSITYNDSAKTVTAAYTGLTSAATYLPQVTRHVKDVAGNNIAAQYTSNFVIV